MNLEKIVENYINSQDEEFRERYLDRESSLPKTSQVTSIQKNKRFSTRR